MNPRTRQYVTWTLTATLLLSVVGIGFLATLPAPATDPFTEFYILGPGGTASEYPTNVTASSSAEVIVGITNQEHESVTYQVVVTWDDQHAFEDEVTVADRETTEIPVSVTAPARPGQYVLWFQLYRADQTEDEPYRTLHLNVTVPE